MVHYRPQVVLQLNIQYIYKILFDGQAQTRKLLCQLANTPHGDITTDQLQHVIQRQCDKNHNVIQHELHHNLPTRYNSIYILIA